MKRTTAVSRFVRMMLLAWAACLASTPPLAADSGPTLQIHRTTHFTIEHNFSDEWAAELGNHLENLARQFPAAAAALEVAWPVSPGSTGSLPWRCRAEPAAGGEGHPPLLRAAYSARRHEVSLTWAPGHRPPQEGLAGFFPNAAGTAFDRSPPLMLRISHELAHQLAFDSGLQTRGVMYPVWLAEGLAANFESPGEELRYLGPNGARARRLARLAREGGLLPLAELAAMTETHDLPREARIDLYAQAWGFYRFLAETRDKDLSAHFRNLSALAPGPRPAGDLRAELVASFGPIEALDRAWRSWLRHGLPAPRG